MLSDAALGKDGQRLQEFVEHQVMIAFAGHAAEWLLCRDGFVPHDGAEEDVECAFQWGCLIWEDEDDIIVNVISLLKRTLDLLMQDWHRQAMEALAQRLMKEDWLDARTVRQVIEAARDGWEASRRRKQSKT